MLAAVDIETQGLDARNFLMGCLLTERNPNPEFFQTKEELWKRILALGHSEGRHKRVLNLYAHNATYDFYGYADLTDPHLHWFCNKPFIVTYRYKGKEIIKFLDTYSLYTMKLADVGDLIGLPKLDTPPFLMETDHRMTSKDYHTILPYLERDTAITLSSVHYLKQVLKEQRISIRRLYTKSQIGVNHLINKLKDFNFGPITILKGSYRIIKQNNFFWDIDKGITRKTRFPDHIHNAYRGGKVECFRTGILQRVSYVDCNSLYPYSSTLIRFPNLASETFHRDYSYDEFLSSHLPNIGVSRVLMKNNACTHGLLAIRTQDGNYFPKLGKYFIGTYTHHEIATALQEGYSLIASQWCITWNETLNPFREITPELYNLRTSAPSPFLNYFYKMLMNCSYGKLGQTRHSSEWVVDSVEKAEEYLQHNWKLIKGIGTHYLYKKEPSYRQHKPYYTPILPVLINAQARLYMHTFLKKVPLHDLVYSDTDSCLFTGNYLHLFPLSNKMGEFKLEHEDEPCIIYGRKTYSIGKHMKIGGITQRSITHDQFEQGYIISKRMVTMSTTQDLSTIGSFQDVERNLHTQLKEHRLAYELLDQEPLLIDADINDIEYFMSYISDIFK